MKNYAVTMILTNKNNSTKLTYYGNVWTFDQDYEVISKDTIYVGKKSVQRLCDENDFLNLEVTIHCLKEDAKDDSDESGVDDSD